jgi:peptidyl-prolyl cis-trans isomerase A (cyclophilin A)
LVTWLVASAAMGCTPRDTAQSATSSAIETAPPALTDPDPAALSAAAPDSFTLVFETSAGEIEVRVRRDWAPLGVDRLHYLASNGFFEGARFFRVVPGFVVQFGLSGRPAVDKAFKSLEMEDDPVKVSNRRGTLVFATQGPNTRTTQLFINTADNAFLDEDGFAPMGEVVRGMDVVDRINPEYLEQSNVQGRIEREGNAFFERRFPALDSIVRVTVGS